MTTQQLIPIPEDPKEGAVPAFPTIVADGDGWGLRGWECSECKARFNSARSACASCFARDSLKELPLSLCGKLHVFSIVHRSYPGIPVPYVSAIVDLEGGGTLKGNLVGVLPKPEDIPFGMAVKVVFGDAQGQQDEEGRPYVSHYFQPLDS